MGVIALKIKKTVNLKLEYIISVVIFRLLLDWTYYYSISKRFAYSGLRDYSTYYRVVLSWIILLLSYMVIRSIIVNKDERSSNIIITVLYYISFVPFTTCGNDWVSFSSSKYSIDYLKLRVSDALNYVALDYYLNVKKKKYVSNGTRSVVHETNVQNYYQEHYNFRKAYVTLKIVYRPFLRAIINIVLV